MNSQIEINSIQTSINSMILEHDSLSLYEPTHKNDVVKSDLLRDIDFKLKQLEELTKLQFNPSFMNSGNFAPSFPEPVYEGKGTV